MYRKGGTEPFFLFSARRQARSSKASFLLASRAQQKFAFRADWIGFAASATISKRFAPKDRALKRITRGQGQVLPSDASTIEDATGRLELDRPPAVSTTPLRETAVVRDAVTYQ
jgi:hypothetical protein